MKTAIDKLRSIEKWTGWMDEHFNDKVKSVSDFEKLYDLADRYSIEFPDDDYVTQWINKEPQEAKAFVKEAHEILGYELYGEI